MSEKSFEQLRTELTNLILEACSVEDVKASDVDPDEILIGGPGVLRLDSLDAVEIAVALQNKYQVKIKNVSSARSYFRSVNSLSAYVYAQLYPTAAVPVFTTESHFAGGA